MCAEGWALWVLGRWPDLAREPPGVPARWGRRLRPNLWAGPPLGAPRWCVRLALAGCSHPPTAPWGIQKGKADVSRGETGASRTSRAGTQALFWGLPTL
jgi:hypothetical protein